MNLAPRPGSRFARFFKVQRPAPERRKIRRRFASWLLDESDKIVVPICSKCGLVAVRDIERGTTYCPICGDVATNNVEMAYAFKLLLNELMGMCIYPKLRLEDKA